MAIIKTGNQFHLKTKNTSYILGVYNDKYPVHLYWGEKMSDNANLEYFTEEPVADRAAGIHNVINEEKHLFLSDVSFEFSAVAEGMFREPTVHALYKNKSTLSDFEYAGYEIYEGKKKLKGLPALYTEEGDKAQTLEICMKDKMSGLCAYLCYCVFEDYDVITRSIRYKNDGNEMIELLSAQSATVDFYAPGYSLLHMSGDWVREANVELTPIDHGRICIDSKRGSSSAMAQPFAALAENNVSETSGNVYAFSLVYSGSFLISAEKDSVGQTRINAGIQPFDFAWELNCGEEFQAPEVVMVYSNEGLGKMSRTYHKIYRERLCRGKFRDEERPLLINHWDATGVNFTDSQLREIADIGAKAGMELFVMDDGWFGETKEGVRPLGDWFPNKDKLPDGLSALVKHVNDSGMKFGIWFEPEIVSPETHVYKNHPDWVLGAPNKESTQMYYQLHLDYAKKEVRDYIIDSISAILDSANIEYVKWDYNRAMIETSNRMHRHKCILGLYEVLETLINKYPDVLFEGCSSGGGRFDPGMLYYMPQTWTSDNQKAVSRMKIQHGMSMVYPPITMGAHAGQVRIGLDGFNDALNTSAMVAMGGNFGFEMDLAKLSEDETKQVADYVKLYKEIRHTVQFGDMYRIGSPFKNEHTAWEYVDENRAVVFTHQHGYQINGEEWRIKLMGLDENAVYECNGKEYSGEALMKLGYRVLLTGVEWESRCLVFNRIFYPNS